MLITTRSCFFNHVLVPQEGANDTLDEFYAIHVKWRARIGRCRLLDRGAVGNGGILVQR